MTLSVRLHAFVEYLLVMLITPILSGLLALGLLYRLVWVFDATGFRPDMALSDDAFTVVVGISFAVITGMFTLILGWGIGTILELDIS